MFNQRLTLILVACFFISATLAFDMKVRELKRIADRCPWHVSENATAGELNSSDLVVDCGCCRRFNNLWAFSRALAFGYCTQTTIAFRGGHTCIVGATNRVFNFTILRQNSSRSFSPWKYDGDPIAQARQHLSHSIQLVYFQYQGAKNILKSHVAECMRQVRLLACEKHRATSSLFLTSNSRCFGLGMPHSSRTASIHLRSGDIMTEAGARANPHYAQPPLAWYRAILSQEWHLGSLSKVRVVSSDRNHVLLPALTNSSEFRSRFDIEVDVSDNFDRQLQVIICSGVVILGRSSMSTWLMPHLDPSFTRDVYIPQKCDVVDDKHQFFPFFSFLYLCDKGIKVWGFSAKSMEQYSLFKTYNLNASQRQEMLEYSYNPTAGQPSMLSDCCLRLQPTSSPELQHTRPPSAWIFSL